MLDRIPRTVVHYGLLDPHEHRGGVETFARNLAQVFENVLFMTPQSQDLPLVRREGWLVICDNQHCLDWPPDMPVVGFQHGFALRKAWALRRRGDLGLALRQARAARRPNTLWVADAEWVQRSFGRWFGNRARHLVLHAVNLAQFDGRLDNDGSKLILHDGRTPHKGSALYPILQREMPHLRFEGLNCPPDQVADRMRGAAAFLHLSRYEGNSLVCNEAMAMNLPCLFTRVGLFLDGGEPFDVDTVSVKEAFTQPRRLEEKLRALLAKGARTPRRWVEAHASVAANRAAWGRVVDDFRRSFGDLSQTNRP